MQPQDQARKRIYKRAVKEQCRLGSLPVGRGWREPPEVGMIPLWDLGEGSAGEVVGGWWRGLWGGMREPQTAAG